MKTINEHWKHFEASVMPKEAPEIQRIETKRAFFAGFATAYDVMMSDVAALSDDDAQDSLASLHKQLLGFNEAIKLGSA